MAARTPRHETGLKERQRKGIADLVRNFVILDHALSVVVLDLGAMLAHQRFDFHLVEAAARHHQARGRPASKRPQRCDDAIDVRFDVDAGLVLKLRLAVSWHGHNAADLLTNIRRHDFPNVREGDDGGVPGHVLELVRAVAIDQKARRPPHVIGDQTRPDSDGQDEQRNNYEITRSVRHGRPPQAYTRMRALLFEHVFPAFDSPPGEPQAQPDNNGQADQARRQ
jgi:hypothetical protein